MLPKCWNKGNSLKLAKNQNKIILQKRKITMDKYFKIPQELKTYNRWICYKVVERNGELAKIPMSAFGGCASCRDPNTWTNFKVAVMACEKYNYTGIGFILGEDKNSGVNFLGVDLDNHPDKITGEKLDNIEFKNLINEFVGKLNSYSEYSHSGEGVHIICKGHLPKGNRRKNGSNVEMYDDGRYFTMTGNALNDFQVEEREEEIKLLWEKYLKTEDTVNKGNAIVDLGGVALTTTGGMNFNAPLSQSILLSRSALSDQEVLDLAVKSADGPSFYKLYYLGDMSEYRNDHSAADLGLLLKLAFWTGRNPSQMDRLFRASALMREKWDSRRGDKTYGEIQIEDALRKQLETYTLPREKVELPKKATVEKNEPIASDGIMFDEYGDPILTTKKIFKSFPLNDTGNAERFYEQFGNMFKYNKTNKVFMYWTGKKWAVDEKDITKKCADKLIQVMKQEIKDMANEIEGLRNSENSDADKVSELEEIKKAMIKNVDRVSNKAGKEAMLSELEHLHDIPLVENELDTQGNLLNTLSGVVDLDTSEIKPFDRKLLISKSTNTGVSFEEPTVWNKFLHDIFKRDNEEETEQIIDCVQKAIGYCLSDSIKEQCMFILHGDGSNGKSTFIEELCYMLGNYGVTGTSDLLVQGKNDSGQATQFELAGYKGTRLISVSETDEGSKFAEARIKAITGNAEVRAQQKYGQPFTYAVTYKIWLATNPKPIIRGTDLGIWRRVYYIPFERKFTDKEKDTSMPEKLRAETPKILGWAIKGYQRYKKEGLTKPKCLEEAGANYRNEMDVINSWISEQCTNFAGFSTKAIELFNDYKNWAKDGVEYLMSNTKFGQELMKKGYKKIRKSDGFYYVGLKLNSNHRAMNFNDVTEEG